jgi:ribose-phosphate pyrophosphokinase
MLAFAAHGLFTGSAAQTLAGTLFDGVVITDSVPPWRLGAEGAVRARLHVASAAPLFADAVRNAHRAWRR